MKPCHQLIPIVLLAIECHEVPPPDQGAAAAPRLALSGMGDSARRVESKTDGALPIASATVSVPAQGGSGKAATSTVAHYELLGARIDLVVEGGKCRLLYEPQGAAQQELMLDLTPPCYMLTWHRSPPRGRDNSGLSDGKPVGREGQPQAWRYPSARGAIVFAIVGDRATPKVVEDGYDCTSSLQGIVLNRNLVSLTRKREHDGVFCADAELEEKSYWLLAHGR